MHWPGEAAAVAMTPTIVVHDGKRCGAGLAGQSKIITTLPTFLWEWSITDEYPGGVTRRGFIISGCRRAQCRQWFSLDTVNALRHWIQRADRAHDGADVSPYWSDAECIAIDRRAVNGWGAGRQK